jgi:hypothetical protein
MHLRSPDPLPRLLLARIDPASEIAEGDDAEFWIDINRVYYFDADTGHNLLRKDDEIADTEHKTGNSDRQPETTQAGTS